MTYVLYWIGIGILFTVGAQIRDKTKRLDLFGWGIGVILWPACLGMYLRAQYKRIRAMKRKKKAYLNRLRTEAYHKGKGRR